MLVAEIAKRIDYRRCRRGSSTVSHLHRNRSVRPRPDLVEPPHGNVILNFIQAERLERFGVWLGESPLGDSPPERRLPSLEAEGHAPSSAGLLPLVPSAARLSTAASDATADALLLLSVSVDVGELV